MTGYDWSYDWNWTDHNQLQSVTTGPVPVIRFKDLLVTSHVTTIFILFPFMTFLFLFLFFSFLFSRLCQRSAEYFRAGNAQKVYKG